MYSREELKQCLECRWRKKQIKLDLMLLGILAAVFLVFGLFELILHLDDYKDYPDLLWILPTTLVGFLLLIFLFILPWMIYTYTDYKKVLKLSEQAELYDVILDHPSTSWGYRGAVYYTVRFQTNDRENITADTKPLWSSLPGVFPIEEYNNKKIEILYHKEENRVIVLGLKDWNKNINKK
ncbi:MAG: hypothetical protein K2J93_03190 [Anaeroplasmataceae bacterium]|nr:hypothetical protein [Anaeroplasmataceae bacterium]